MSKNAPVVIAKIKSLPHLPVFGVYKEIGELVFQTLRYTEIATCQCYLRGTFEFDENLWKKMPQKSNQM